MKEEKKEKQEKQEVEVLEEVEEGSNKKKKRVIIFIIVGIFLLILIYLFFTYKDMILISKKDKKTNEDNISYLTSKYGDNINVSLVAKKKKKKYNLWQYDVCSKTTELCIRAEYYDDKKNWEFLSGEGFLYTLLFLDDVVTVLDKNKISYKLYGNNETPFELATKFILVVKKDNDNSLIGAIKEIDSNSLTQKLCSYSSDSTKKDCTGELEINIFNTDDYDAVISKYPESYGLGGYYDLYQVLFDLYDIKFKSKLGANIVRNRINDNMFVCNDELCNSYKHLTYRYVIGNYNYFKNSIIIEGL